MRPVREPHGGSGRVRAGGAPGARRRRRRAPRSLDATTAIRARRRAVVDDTPDWDELRRAGEAIRTDALQRLDELLVVLERAVDAAGGEVHWARDALEANEIVTGARPPRRGERRW